VAFVRCPCCANPLPDGGQVARCAGCLRHAPAFDATIVASSYAPPVDQLVLRLKFGGTLALAPWFGLALADALRRSGIATPALLLPVPLGERRLVERGFNQALEIARPLARNLGLPLRRDWLVRTRETAAQSQLEPGARRGNVKGAFTLAPAAVGLLHGRHVGVVDDVMSSGHTLDEVARTLRRFGAARVTNLVFARTPPRDE
jgi:ComF family protein